MSIGIDEVWADIDYLIARVEQKTMTREEAVAIVRKKLDTAPHDPAPVDEIDPMVEKAWGRFESAMSALDSMKGLDLDEIGNKHSDEEGNIPQDAWEDFAIDLLRAVSAPREPVPTLAKHQPCGCVICTCEDEQQCQGCGAKHCGNRADHPPYVGQQPAAPSAPMGVAYLDIGAGGYTDIGTELSDQQLAQLPKGRHMLGIVGTYGIDGYVPGTPLAPPVDAELQRDAERLDWLMLMVSGRELRRIGVDTSGNCTRQDIDAAIQARRQQGGE